MIALCSKTYCCYDEETDTVKLSSKELNRNNIEEPLNKYRKVLFNEERVYSINRGFRVVDNKKVCTYELKKLGLSYFYPNCKVCEDGIHTTPLNLQLVFINLIFKLPFSCVFSSQYSYQYLFSTKDLF